MEMAQCNQHDQQCEKVTAAEKRIQSCEVHLDYMRQTVNELQKLPQQFWEFRAEMRSMLRTWGAGIGCLIAIVGVIARFK